MKWFVLLALLFLPTVTAVPVFNVSSDTSFCDTVDEARVSIKVLNNASAVRFNFFLLNNTAKGELVSTAAILKKNQATFVNVSISPRDLGAGEYTMKFVANSTNNTKFVNVPIFIESCSLITVLIPDNRVCIAGERSLILKATNDGDVKREFTLLVNNEEKKITLGENSSQLIPVVVNDTSVVLSYLGNTKEYSLNEIVDCYPFSLDPYVITPQGVLAINFTNNGIGKAKYELSLKGEDWLKLPISSVEVEKDETTTLTLVADDENKTGRFTIIGKVNEQVYSDTFYVAPTALAAVVDMAWYFVIGVFIVIIIVISVLIYQRVSLPSIPQPKFKEEKQHLKKSPTSYDTIDFSNPTLDTSYSLHLPWSRSSKKLLAWTLVIVSLSGVGALLFWYAKRTASILVVSLAALLVIVLTFSLVKKAAKSYHFFTLSRGIALVLYVITSIGAYLLYTQIPEWKNHIVVAMILLFIVLIFYVLPRDTLKRADGYFFNDETVRDSKKKD